jgi:hypothetical protein
MIINNLMEKSMSKRSTPIVFFLESRGWCEPDKKRLVEWTCERFLEPIVGKPGVPPLKG